MRQKIGGPLKFFSGNILIWKWNVWWENELMTVKLQASLWTDLPGRKNLLLCTFQNFMEILTSWFLTRSLRIEYICQNSRFWPFSRFWVVSNFMKLNLLYMHAHLVMEGLCFNKTGSILLLASKLRELERFTVISNVFFEIFAAPKAPQENFSPKIP